MQRHLTVMLAVVAVSAIGMAGCKKESPQKAEVPQSPVTSSSAAPAAKAPAAAGKSAEQMFTQFCASCHPKGGNTMNPQKTLEAKAMANNKITTADDIVKVMRNPGRGMPKFDEATISDQDARSIGEYILTTFR
jgi:cytochrome c6